ncbi:PadR family transcriptional regulator [Natrialbaceae archaeon A-arb3/5]
MREDTINTESVLDELSMAAMEGSSESSGIAIETDETATDPVGHELDELMAQVTEALPTGEPQFDEAIVKENLDELLLMLIALHGETHGEELISDLGRFFETDLSPGTIYPALHELKEEEILSMHTKVRTKEYSIADDEHVRATIEQSMVQHMAFGLLLYAFLSRV